MLSSTRVLELYKYVPDEVFLLAKQWHPQGTGPECRLSLHTPQAVSGGVFYSHTSFGPVLDHALAELQGLVLLKSNIG